MNLSSLRPTNLHLSHLWGGGTETWVADFAAADGFSDNLVLQSLGSYECYGISLRLIHAVSATVLGTWVLRHPISEVRAAHPEYADILAAVCEEFDIGHIYVSSVIGHALDVFHLGVPCTKIYHDYFPYCPAFFITRDGLCTSCGEEDLRLCKNWDTSHRPKNSPGYYKDLRDALLNATVGARHVSPSRGLPGNLRTLDSRWEKVYFDIIEHGIVHRKQDFFGGAEEDRRLRVGLLGLLGWNKGREVVRRSFETMRAIVDLHIIGGAEAGAEYEARWGASFVHHYAQDELPAILEQHRLDLVIFLSQVPETFSYTLSEAWCFCIPPAALRVGAHAERIEEGVDGFFFEPGVDAVVEFLLWADRERDELRRVARRLREKPVRSVEEAVCDYYCLRTDYMGELDRRLEHAL